MREPPDPPARSGLPTDAHALFDRPLADRVAAVALSGLTGVGPVRWRTLISAHAGDGARAAAAIGTKAPEWTRAIDGAARTMRPRVDGLVVVIPGDAGYPRALLDLPDAPPLLWIRGDPTALTTSPRVAIVGTRHNTSAGAYTTRRLVASLGATGACVVSGLARGIDAVAHEAALDADLVTVAVLATGADVPYPAQHRALYARILAHGAVVSEQPPGTPAVPGAFPRRNRIIAALAECTVVVEAPERSGALITADIALDVGRTVAAVPGPIDAPASRGTNALLRDGAHVLATPDDLRALLEPAVVRPSAARASGRRERARAAPPSVERRPDLAGDELALWEALEEPAADPDVAAARAGLSARHCATALLGLELRGVIATELTGTIRRL